MPLIAFFDEQTEQSFSDMEKFVAMTYHSKSTLRNRKV